MSSDSSKKPLRLPRSTWFIVSTEACERFSFYGMTSILTIYLQTLFLHQYAGTITDSVKDAAGAFATERVHLFNAAVYYLPLLGGFLADKYFGRYRTILGLSLFYCLGHGSLALFEGKEWGIYLGLGLIALGAGGIKPCVSAFVADQFDSLDEHGLSKIYGIFYWAVNLGAALAFAIIPAVAENPHLGYRWAFGIPGIFMAVAALVYWSGTSLYVKRPPQTKSDVHLDPQQRVADRKTLLRIVIVLSPILIFWALYYQLNTSWVLQGSKMQPYYPFGASDESGSSYSLNAQTIQSASAILVLILVPVMAIWGYPLMQRVGLPTSMIAKMAMGMVAIASSFVVVGLFQNYLDSGGKMSILWQLLAYVPLEVGEVMVSVTGLEFAYARAPTRMKSVVMGVWFCITASGNLLVAFITWLNEKWMNLTAAQLFYFYAVLMLCGVAAFLLIAKGLIEDTTSENAKLV
jgi:proton-dependent oligopeptide transporter, POT family